MSRSRQRSSRSSKNNFPSLSPCFPRGGFATRSFFSTATCSSVTTPTSLPKPWPRPGLRCLHGRIHGWLVSLPQAPAGAGKHDGHARSISGLIASVAVLYQRRIKPRRGAFWMSLGLIVAAGFLVFTCVVWKRPVQYAFLGVLWGSLVGLAMTWVYLRHLKGTR